MKPGAIAAIVSALLLCGCVHLPGSAYSDADAEAAGDALTNATSSAAIIRDWQILPLNPASPKPLLDQAMIQLAKTDPRQRYRGITYDLTRDNLLDSGWLVQTPNIWGKRAAEVGFFPLECIGDCDPDFALPICSRDAACAAAGGVCARLDAFNATPERAGKRTCLGHSDGLVDRFYRLIAGAHEGVDITTLQPLPDYRFLAALRNAITALTRSGQTVTVRFLIGQYPSGGFNIEKFLEELVRDAKAIPGGRLTVYAAMMQSCAGEPSCGSFSWNHAKIVTVDGRAALVGGHNMWSPDYLVDEPIHDISMQLRGSAAADAHRYADRLWQFVCDREGGDGPPKSFMYRSGNEDVQPGCLPKIKLLAKPAGRTGSVPVLAVGRLGSGITSDFANQGDIARVLFFGAARHSIRVAQQDVAFSLPGESEPLYPELALKAWAEFMLAGRGDVYLVLSNPGALGRSKSTYSNGIALEAVAAKMLQVTQGLSSLSPSAVTDLLCSHFHLAPFRFGPDASWPEEQPIGNHGKFWMVDDRYFYIGSDNLYPVDLQEFGYIVDDRRAAAEIRRSYWDPLWKWSRPAAISGADAPSCVLRNPPAS